jgi:putative FmdB family regulatory protein
MPIYAYRCATCGHAQDVLRKISDPPLSVCPACGAATFVKQVTAAGFQLKGSGWYVTDFRGDKKAAKPSDGDAAAASEGKAAEGDAAPANGKDAAKSDTAKSEPAAAPAPAPAAAPAAAPAPTTPPKGAT